MIEVVSVFTPEYKSNTYILRDKEFPDAIIIDPTIYSFREINDYLLRNSLSIDYVIPTHGHFDHIEGIETLSKLHQFDVIANPACSIAFQNSKKNYSYYFQNKNIKLPAPNILIDEDIYQFRWNNTEINIIKTPGHSPCSICIKIGQSILFSGDSILTEYKSFSKFPDSNVIQLRENIEMIYKMMPHEIITYPGHGEPFELGSITTKFDFLVKSI